MKKISGQTTKAVPHPAKHAVPMTGMPSSLLEASELQLWNSYFKAEKELL